MNRRNYTLHLALAGALVVLAAAAGRIERWEGSQHTEASEGVVAVEPAAPVADPPAVVGGGEEQDDVEVLVRFKPGVSDERLEEIAASLKDRVGGGSGSVGGVR